MKYESFELNGFLPYQLSVMSERIRKELTSRFVSEFQLSIPEWRVLAQLWGREGISVRELHAAVAMDKSKVSRAASRLESAGLVEKRENADDRRLLQIRLTQSGNALAVRLFPIAHAFESELADRLGEDAPAFRRAIERLMAWE
ncbi:MarR family winged helix-turn-helix transcriptional regulator [Neotabrizicola sp. sgz301269]|uniref:MarR family winged helix-turn-helix transcriptional regulator n=1 Tax=Neotabrizicola sp. sgz301269 TaxID=3276282 RepID=UPI00376FF8F3